jgi:pyridoxal phosphate enzyme (YggS family)
VPEPSLTAPSDDRRRSELVTALAAVRARIAEVCASVGRDPRAVTLIAVTKTRPASDVVTLAQLGVRDVGENRDQEAAAKVSEVAGLLEPAVPRPHWHFLGQIQSRKARSIASYAGTVHSVDRVDIAARLADAVAARKRERLDVFVQVSLDGDPARGGVVAASLPSVAEAVASRPELRLRGLMAVAPLGGDPDEAFTELAELSARLRERHPSADAISAGMSADLDAALRHGATHVRVGTALLGRRAPVIG